MKKLISMLLVGMMLASMVGCESEEERQARILEAVKDRVEYIMTGNEAWEQLTNKEWEIIKKDDKYIVTLHGDISYYMMSCGVAYRFTVSSDMYISNIGMYIGDYSKEEELDKNEMTKLDI